MRQAKGLRLRLPALHEFQGEARLRTLTVKLRGRAPTPNGAEGAQSLSARGANPQALHGPLQRLLEDAFIEATVRARSLTRKPAVRGIRLSAPPGGERSHGRCSINNFLLRRAPRSQAKRSPCAHSTASNEESLPSVSALTAFADKSNLGADSNGEVEGSPRSAGP
jgi:hypothetical protein